MDQDAIAEMFSAYGPIQSKRMFSGFGLYSEGVCFCLVLRGGEFYFKVDETSAPRFEAEGCKPFSYSQRRSGKVVTVNSFWQMPERLYDDPDELADWTRQAVAVALRLQLVKSSRKKKAAAKAPSTKRAPRRPAKAAPRKPSAKRPAKTSKTAARKKRRAWSKPPESASR
jgi:DNA transformation protein and related proteins